MAISVRVRFEVFKRDDFTCRYCGRKSPEVVLEVDHIVPVCEGGSDDPMNLATSCWECNSGKSGIPLAQVMTGEDPHDKAVLLLEQERQLREYNVVLAQVNERVSAELRVLCDVWPRELSDRDYASLRALLFQYPAPIVQRAMQFAIDARKTSGLAYVVAVLKNMKQRGEV